MLLVFIIAFSDSTSGRRYAVTNSQRHRKVLEALTSSGSSLFHTENWWLDSAHVIILGGGAAATGATAVAAEATAMVPAAGILRWFGVTVAAPTAIAVAATTAIAVAATTLLPAIVSGTVGAGAMYLYKSYWWRNFTTFPDPRRHGCPANGKPLSTQEKGESACASGGSLSGVSAGFSAGLASASALSSGVLLGAYIGSNVARVFAAFSPGAAVKYAPSIARNVAYGVALGAKYVS
jgi:hypothetical protein